MSKMRREPERPHRVLSEEVKAAMIRSGAADQINNQWFVDKMMYADDILRESGAYEPGFFERLQKQAQEEKAANK
jgi:hypothetical protein